MSYQLLIAESLRQSIAVKQTALQQLDTIEACGELLIEALAGGGRVFFCGNGGSAADSQHLAAELIGRFETDNCLPALALTTDTSILTAVGNDFGFDEVFSRQLRALARPGDALVAITTSGNSPNVLKAVEAAHTLGVKVVGMTGGGGGRLAELADLCLQVDCPRTCRVQEVHITVGHIWCEMVEEARRRGRIAAPACA